MRDDGQLRLPSSLITHHSSLLYGLAMRNLTRRPLRAAVTTAGVALAVAAFFSIVSFQRGYQRGLRMELDRLGAHLLVVPKGCPYDAASMALHGANWPCYLKDRYLEEVRAAPGVAMAAPVFMAALPGSQPGEQLVYLGVRPDILGVKRSWQIQGAFPARPGEVLAGSAVATERHWRVGQTVELPGRERSMGTARLCGIMAATQGADDQFLYLPLADAQRLFHRPNRLTHILVRLRDPNDMDRTVEALRGCDAGMNMNVVPLAHLFHTIQNLVNSARLLLACVALVAALISASALSNALLMAVSERTREIGVLRALGASRAHIFRLIWLETVQISLAGGVLGILVAVAGCRAVEDWLRSRLPYAPDAPLVHPEALVVGTCLLGALALGSVSGLLPAWRAAGLSPVEAIRTGK
jgi:putative ABC transport system permease protein